MKSSIISSSEDSIQDKYGEDDDDNPFNRGETQNNTRLSRKELMEAKIRISKEVTGRVQRMLTTDNFNRMNDSQSTFLNHKPSVKQQVDCLSNLQLNAETSSAKKKGTLFSSIAHTDKNKLTSGGLTGTMLSAADPRATVQSKLTDKVNPAKNEKRQIYQDIGEYFSGTKPINPLSYIDGNKQKVMINPGVPYISTSQNEIFQRREFLFQKEYLNKLNPFIAAPKDEVVEGQYEGDEEETYIGARFEAYQMKTLYKVAQRDEI